MSRGIVKIKPPITGKGSLEIDEITPPNTYNLTVAKSTLAFQNPEPAFTVNVGTLVECEILSDSFCKVTRVIQY